MPDVDIVSARTAGWLATARVAVSLALAVALIGLAIPYGASTPGTISGPNVFEWALSGAALLAGLGLLADVFRPLHPRLYRSGIAFALATAVWAAVAAYHLLIGPLIGWAYAISEATRCAAWAALALYEYRRVALAPEVEVETRG